MKNEIQCNYCKKKRTDNIDIIPIWFGKYKHNKRIAVICDSCLPKNREHWRGIKS